MEKEAFQFTIGEFTCYSLNDGYHDYTLEAFFANVERQEVENALLAGNWTTDCIPSPWASLYINTGQHRVLIDTGVGNFIAGAGKLPENLQEAGVKPDDIDVLIITHAHPDHVGGILQEDGAPTYPNATIYTAKQEWEFWLSEDALEKAPSFKSTIDFAHKVFDALGDRFSYLQPDAELIPGIRPLTAFGHTPGHLAVEVASGNDAVLYISDTVFHPLHIEHPHWLPNSRYIFELEQYTETARRLIDRAATQHTLVHGMHFPPFPCLGYIIKDDNVLQWQPIES